MSQLARVTRTSGATRVALAAIAGFDHKDRSAATLMLMAHFDRVAIAVHDDCPPTDDEWALWIERCRESGSREPRALVESHSGAGPDAKQRRVLAQATRGYDARAAILTESLVVRGIVTAIAWLGIPQRAFPPGHYDAAADFLGLTAEERARAVEELARLKAERDRRLAGRGSNTSP